jgi:hypothetical protein
MIDLRPQLSSPAIHELICHLEYPPDIREALTDQILLEYRNAPEQPRLGILAFGIAILVYYPRKFYRLHVESRRGQQYNAK